MHKITALHSLNISVHSYAGDINTPKSKNIKTCTDTQSNVKYEAWFLL